MYGRDGAAGDEAAWTCHATGSLISHERGADAGGSAAVLDEWPPAGAVPVDITELYPKLASQGLGYGAAFRGLTEAWRDERGLSAAPCFPIGSRNGRRLRHSPSLAGCSLPSPGGRKHCGFGKRDSQGLAQVLLPFAWSDVTLQATGASELRVRMMLPDGAEAVGSATMDSVRCAPAAGREGGRAPSASGDGRAGAEGIAVRCSRSLPYRLASRDPRRWSAAELTVGGIRNRRADAGAWGRGLCDGVGALCCARWWSGGPGSGDRGCAADGRRH